MENKNLRSELAKMPEEPPQQSEPPQHLGQPKQPEPLQQPVQVPQQPVQVPQSKLPSKNNGCCIGAVITALIVVFILIVIGGIGYYFLKYNHNSAFWSKIESKINGTTSTVPTNGLKYSDESLVGHWDTGCLVASHTSSWVERHEFVIEANGNATHWRSMGENCAVAIKEAPQEYKLDLVAPGKVNFLARETGEINFYDIYQVLGDTLEFGYGVRMDYANAGTHFGGSEADRFETLNTFLAYKKQAN